MLGLADPKTLIVAWDEDGQLTTYKISVQDFLDWHMRQLQEDPHKYVIDDPHGVIDRSEP